MSNPAKPPWPDSGTQSFVQPFAQGLAGGMDFMKKMWGQVPGTTAVPNFLMPTLDLDELDKRIADLKAAESWLEVNLNLLRATIQGLEVQRHTIAAIRSLGVASDTPRATSITPPTPSGLPPGWPVAQDSEPPTRVAPTPSKAPDAATSPTKTPAPSAASPLAGVAAGNWLGYMQDQFAKVAQAALASSPMVAAKQSRDSTAVPNQKARAKTGSGAQTKAASKTVTKTRAKRPHAANKLGSR